MGLRTWLGLKKKSGPDIDPLTIGRGYQVIEDDLIDPNFPVDIVYTWVDGSEPAFLDQLKTYLPRSASQSDNAFNPERWRNHEELRYSLRSIAKYAPWVNHIYVVTNGQRPKWLASHPKISIVPHRSILDDQFLPTFNSHVIESALHRIPGLAEHYVYLNDDVLLLRPIQKTGLFTSNGLMYNFLSASPYPSGEPSEVDLPSVQSAKNSIRLIYRQWGVWMDRRYKHTFHPLRKSVAADNERIFAREYGEFRPNRFRAINDLLCCSVLHGNAGYLTGRALFRKNRTRYVAIRSPETLRIYKHMLADRSNGRAAETVSLNDAARSDDILPGYADYLRSFLEEYFPEPSEFESATMVTIGIDVTTTG